MFFFACEYCEYLQQQYKRGQGEGATTLWLPAVAHKEVAKWAVAAKETSKQQQLE